MLTQSSQPQTGVLFDIDGTLVDSNYQHTYAWWRVLQQAGYRVPMFETHRRIGMGGDHLLEELIGEYSEELSTTRARYFRFLSLELTVSCAAFAWSRATGAGGTCCSPRMPGGELTALPLIWLTGLAGVLVFAGLAGFRRRDLASTA